MNPGGWGREGSSKYEEESVCAAAKAETLLFSFPLRIVDLWIRVGGEEGTAAGPGSGGLRRPELAEPGDTEKF